MFDVERLLGQMLSGGVSRKKKKSKSSFGIPGVSNAQLGVGAVGLAIAAWEHFKTKQQQPVPQPYSASPAPAPAMPMPPPPPPPMAIPPAPVAQSAAGNRQADAAHLIRAMIAAANADGLIDAEERAAILERAMEAGLDAATQQFLMGELRTPATLEAIVAATRPELRFETYAAALIAISIDTEAERAYLDRLAAALQLSAQDRQRIHDQVGA